MKAKGQKIMRAYKSGMIKAERRMRLKCTQPLRYWIRQNKIKTWLSD